MKRRTFLKQSLAATSLAGAAPLMQTVHAADKPAAAEYYEVRTYTLKAAAQQKAVTEYLTQALGPALNRQGVTPVGVFTEMPALPADQIPLVHMVAVYSSVEQFGGVRAKLAADAAFKKAGAAYLGVPATEAAYLRAESSLLAAISGMPRLEIPGKNTKVYNLRIYESHSETAGQKKIEMFNVGELAIFRRTGLKPVFFGETIVGSRMPNLTYMLAFDNDEARNAAWGRFREDPEWVKLKAIPEYADKNIVSKITNKLLAPVAGSQI